MKAIIYKIGTYKNGQQIAKEVFLSKNLDEVKIEFIRMYENTDFCPEGTDNQPETGEDAWYYKHFSEDTNNVAVFQCKNEHDPCLTNYVWTGGTSNRMR